MNFLVDAQLPRRIAVYLRAQGHDAVHTLDLPEANRTTDAAILVFAEHEQRVVVTKDSDFVDSFILSGKPEKLLLNRHRQHQQHGAGPRPRCESAWYRGGTFQCTIR
jgi:predicted nuclease of predicted toxin-antitoxin system